MWRFANDNSYVQLQGQGGVALGPGGQRGYAMAALLVGLAVMAILMGAAMPVWSKQAQREREAEYLFRAQEYARGIRKFQNKFGAAFPPTLDVLVEQRFVRRKYKDPLTGEDFQPVFQTAAIGGQPGLGSAGGTNQPGQIANGAPPSGFGSTQTLGQTGGTQTTSQGTPMPGAPVIGVVSKSKASSIKVYNGRTRYDQWAVTYQDVRPGHGLPPDILQAMNAAGAQGQPPGAGAGQPGANPFGAAGTARPGGMPMGQPGANPFGQPGAQPFGQPGAQPFGQPGTNPFNPTGATQGGSPFSPAYPPLPGAPGSSPFGAPPPKKQ